MNTLTIILERTYAKKLPYPLMIGVSVDYLYKRGNLPVLSEIVTKLALAILAQLVIVKRLKKLVKKPRPGDPNSLKSFPSSHGAAAGFSLTLSICNNGLGLKSGITLIGSIMTIAQRYLTKKHDVIDLAAGFVIGSVLAGLVNLYSPKEQHPGN